MKYVLAIAFVLAAAVAYAQIGPPQGMLWDVPTGPGSMTPIGPTFSIGGTLVPLPPPPGSCSGVLDLSQGCIIPGMGP